MVIWVEKINAVVWGVFMQAFLLGTGIFLMIKLKFLPIRKLSLGIKTAFKKSKHSTKEKGDITPFQALMTSLAATIGTGNIAGVATAIAMGGPGAVFWMWITAVFGMATKYGEAVLAVKYRIVDDRGNYFGGPMVAMDRGFKLKRAGKILAGMFSFFTVIASFGIGNMTQANAIADVLNHSFGIDKIMTGIMIAFLYGVVILGGIKSIAGVVAKIVPLMGGLYIIGGLIVIIINIKHVIPGLIEIVESAFTGRAAIGGFSGALTFQAIRYGVSRGVFSNEAGLGSAPIAAAAAKTDYPAKQGIVSMTGTFFDTLIICTITALVISSTHAWYHVGADGRALSGAALTSAAFCFSLDRAGEYIVSVGMVFFAFSSILAWSYYGQQCVYYLIRSKRIIFIYRIVFCIFTIIGASMTLELVWGIADIANGLMAVPNLICLWVLSGVIKTAAKSIER